MSKKKPSKIYSVPPLTSSADFRSDEVGAPEHLSTLLSGDRAVVENSSLEQEATVAIDGSTSDEQKTNRAKRSIQNGSGSIPQRITSLLQETGFTNSSIVSEIFTNASNSEAVRGVQGRPSAEINVERLLKTIEYVSVFISGLDFASAQTYRPLLDGLWGIADELSDVYGQIRVSQYKEAVHTPQQPTEPKEVEVETGPQTNPRQASIERSAEHTLQQLEMLFSPILDPAVFVDNYIKAGIQRYDQQSGTTTRLVPDSVVNVIYRPGPYDPNTLPYNIPAPSSLTVDVPLRDVVTGHYLYAFKQARDSLGRQYSYPLTTFEPSGLINALMQENLQTVMERALSTYGNNPANRTGMTQIYQNMIKLRSLEYLDGPNRDAAYRQAVQAFLAGNIQAHEVSFKGTKLNGAFLIRSGYAGGVLFSVDQPGFFHVTSREFTYRGIGEWVTESVSDFPETTAFKEWLLAKLPSVTAQEYKDSPLSIFRTTETSDLMAVPPSVYLTRPFSFISSPSQSQGDLANKLYDGLMNRLDSDIDYLVFSSWERTTGYLLEVAKTILTVVAIALNTAIPGTGTLLSRIGLFMASLAVDGAYIAASLTQAHIADRPEDAAAFRDEAIFAGVLSGLGAIANGVPLTSRGFTEALALYRQTKLAKHTLIPSALRKVTWPKLADGTKIELLVDSMKDSEPARNLARLSSPGAVEHSIRQNLLLDSLGSVRNRFAWGDLALEQAQVQRRLQSDLVRLSEVNGHIRGLLDSPPVVPRQTLLGDPEQVAANWITSNSRSAADPGSITELQGRIKNALSQNRQADLLHIDTIDRLHSAVYQPTAGQVERVFRSSSDPLFMGSDIARVGFEKALDAIKIKVQAGQVDMGEALFAAIVRYHPYGDGNGRTARTLYALAQLKKQESSFKALTTLAENMLSSLPSRV